MLPSFYDVKHEISSSFDQLEELRESLLARRRMLRFILAGILALSITCFLYASGFILPALAVLIIMIFVYRARMKKASAQFRAAYKEQIVVPLTRKMMELSRLPNHNEQYSYSCEYDPAGRMEDDLIRRSRLFPYEFSSIKGEDLFVGTLGATRFKFSELKVFQPQSGTEEGLSQELIVFQGTLFAADFHRDFEGLTVLTGNLSSENSRAGKLLTNLSAKLHERRKGDGIKIMKTENEDFDAAFLVRTSNEAEAREILTPGMMQRLLDFKDRGRGRYAPVNVSFVDSYMFISIWNHRNQFEVSMNRPVDDEAAYEIYQELSFYFGLIEDFDLNARYAAAAD